MYSNRETAVECARTNVANVVVVVCDNSVDAHDARRRAETIAPYRKPIQSVSTARCLSPSSGAGDATGGRDLVESESPSRRPGRRGEPRRTRTQAVRRRRQPMSDSARWARNAQCHGVIFHVVLFQQYVRSVTRTL
eukprot:6181602-Pleurochrysis_carterae.AAC.3